MKRCVLSLALLSAFAVAFAARGVVATPVPYTQGFEGQGPFDFYNDPGSSAGISTAVAHGGSQSAQFTLDAAPFAYTRWKSEDISSYGLKVNDIVASDWALRTLGRSDLSPYLLFTIATPDTTQETLAIQFRMASMLDNAWTQNVVDRTTTTFHVNGDRTGLAANAFSPSGTQGTLDDLAAVTYSGSLKWGDLPVTRVRIGVGLWDASQAWNGYADDLTVTSANASPVPEPASLIVWSVCGGVGAAGAWLKRRRR